VMRLVLPILLFAVPQVPVRHPAVVHAAAPSQLMYQSARVDLRTDMQVASGFWQSVDVGFAFLSLPDDGAAMLANWQQRFLRRYEWRSRVVVDYGAASGLLGQWLLGPAGGARRYIAVDIAERALRAVEHRLGNAGYRAGVGAPALHVRPNVFPAVCVVVVLEAPPCGTGAGHVMPKHASHAPLTDFGAVKAPVELCDLGRQSGTVADVLVSTKTLQHFPTVDSISSFLRNVRCAPSNVHIGSLRWPLGCHRHRGR
jgi:hypothetical protein